MKELTKGYPAKVILLFSIPLILGNILQQFYNITDSKIVSEYISSSSLAAVGATAVVSNTLTGFVNGLTQGFAIITARCFGEKNYKSLRNYMAGAIKLTLVAAILLMVTGELFIRDFLKLLATPEDIMDEASDYVRIIIGGLLFASIYNLAANSLRAVGDSKRPLWCLIGSIFVNIGLDLLFVLKLGMGIKGAAYATVISQAMAAMACLVFVFTRYRMLLPKRDEWKLDGKRYKNLISVGISMGLMGCIVNIGTIILQSSINDLGTVYITAHTAGRRVFDMMMIFVYTIGVAMTTFASQNMGAGRGDRVRQGVLHSVIVDTLVTAVLIVFAYTIGPIIVKWIASTEDRTIVDAGVMYVQRGVWFFFVLGPLFILRCTLQGMGRKIVPLVSSFLELVTKVVSALVLVPRVGYLGVALTEPISWCIMILPLIVVYILKRPGSRNASS